MQIWDEHYFAFTAVLTVAIQLACFFVAYACHFDLITDFAGSMNKVLLAVLTLCLKDAFYTRQVVLTVLLVLSRTELALFLFYRVCSRKKDGRFDELHNNFWKYLGFWVYQMMWVYATCASVVFVNGDSANPDLNALDWIGWVLFFVGFAVQVLSDFQKFFFRKDPANKGKICEIGVWFYSRHPNYFGEIMIWTGLFVSAANVIVASTSSPGFGWLTAISPVFTTLVLLFVSGLPTAEGQSLKRFYMGDDKGAKWEEYAQGTSPIIPFPRSLYRRIPATIKKMFCCEYDRYKYCPEMDKVIENALSPGYGS